MFAAVFSNACVLLIQCNLDLFELFAGVACDSEFVRIFHFSPVLLIGARKKKLSLHLRVSAINDLGSADQCFALRYALIHRNASWPHGEA